VYETNKTRVSCEARKVQVQIFRLSIVELHGSKEVSEKEHVYDIVVDGVQDKILGYLSIRLDVPLSKVGSVNRNAENDSPDVVVFEKNLLQNDDN